MSMTGRPIFDYPPDRRAPEGEGCLTCGIILEADAIGSHCSPECIEWDDRCAGCQRGPSWCECEVTHCIDCGTALSPKFIAMRLHTCTGCAEVRQEVRRALGPSSRRKDVPT